MTEKKNEKKKLTNVGRRSWLRTILRHDDIMVLPFILMSKIKSTRVQNEAAVDSALSAVWVHLISSVHPRV